MKSGMSLEALLTEVKRQRETKRDFIASTADAVRMVEHDGDAYIVLLREGSSELERFSITDNCHRQIADRLGVPWKYYNRLLADHTDLVLHQVNALFEREPAMRMLRVLDGQVRAFLSDRYRRFDNDELLEQALPPLVKGDVPSVLLSSHVNADKMFLKVLFTGDDLAMDLGDAPKARNRLVQVGNAPGHEIFENDASSGRDIIRPGMVIGNSETGQGSTYMKGFFWRSYCLNGCVFGSQEAWNYSRNHVGGKVEAADGLEIFSDSTRRKEDELIVAQLTDALKAMSDPARVRKMADALRALKETKSVANPVAAVDTLARELVDIRETEKQGILESFIRDGDYSQWGMLNAVTEQANREEVSYERASELEELGAKIAQWGASQWLKVAQAEKVAA